MAFRRSDLQEAFFVPGTQPFRVWGYGTEDSLEQVLTPGYFGAVGGMLRAGELIYISTCPKERRGDRVDPAEPRMALVMVRAADGISGRTGPLVRLVQDFGGPSDAPATLRAFAPEAASAMLPEAPVKRGRGRPPGSRSRKPLSVESGE